MSTGTAGYSKFKASAGTSNIKAKASNIKIPGLFVDTIIINQLTYIHFRQFVQTSNLVEAEVFSFFSSFKDRLSSIEIISHNPNFNSSHT